MNCEAIRVCSCWIARYGVRYQGNYVERQRGHMELHQLCLWDDLPACWTVLPKQSRAQRSTRPSWRGWDFWQGLFPPSLSPPKRAQLYLVLPDSIWQICSRWGSCTCITISTNTASECHRKRASISKKGATHNGLVSSAESDSRYWYNVLMLDSNEILEWTGESGPMHGARKVQSQIATIKTGVPPFNIILQCCLERPEIASYNASLDKVGNKKD